MRIQSHCKDRILRIATAAIVAGCLGMPAAPHIFAQESNPAATSDSGLQTQVTSQLKNDAQLQGQQISATVDNGQVTLSGTVQNQQQWQEAETVVANVSGVRTIQNNLTIAGQPASAQMQPPPPPPEDNQQDQGEQPDTNGGPQTSNQIPPPPPPDNQQQPGGAYQGQAAGNGYGQQPYGQGPYGGQQNYYGQNGYGAPPPPPNQQPSGPVAVPAGTLVQIRTSEPLDTAHLKEGQVFQATVATDVYEGNVLTIPRGAVLQGTVVKAKNAGPFGGSATLELRLTSLNLGGQVYPLTSEVWSNRGPNKAGYTASNAVGGAAFGAIIGGLIGRGAGAAVGAGVGAAAGLGASAASNGPRLILPPETVLNFHLAGPVTVQPVSWQEAQRLASTVPQLQRRPMYPPPPPYYSPYRVYYGW